MPARTITAEQFVSRVEACAPGAAELEEHGLDPDEIEDIRRAFECRPTHDRWSGPPNELRRLLVEFDCSDLEISIVRFDPGSADAESAFVFAVAESDPIGVRDSGVVTMFDHAGGRPIYDIAASPEGFLEALALVAEAFRCRETGGYRREEFAAKCVAAAGSEEYGRLYLVLLPGDD